MGEIWNREKISRKKCKKGEKRKKIQSMARTSTPTELFSPKKLTQVVFLPFDCSRDFASTAEMNRPRRTDCFLDKTAQSIPLIFIPELKVRNRFYYISLIFLPVIILQPSRHSKSRLRRLKCSC